jgi:ADP-ribosyl-[dinitrogen reductase] hydrolase
MTTIQVHRVSGSLYGLLVGDALAVPGHWFYSPTKLRNDYGEITEMVAPQKNHAESMVKGMSYVGSIDIMHDKARFYEGNTLAQHAQAKQLKQEEIQARTDDHGNYVGATEDERVHYHASLKRGQNTVNACVARLLIRYLGETNQNQGDYYDPDEFLERFKTYMTTPPNDNDLSQVHFHNDVYMDVFLRYFFTQASKGTALRHCAMSQRDQWSIGSLDGVVMCIPIIAAYCDEPESVVIGRAVEHHMLTHRSITVTMVVSILVPLLLELYRGADLPTTLDRALVKMRPPKCTGREMRDSYVANHGPGKIPKHDKWLQHMLTTDESMKDFVHRMALLENMEDVAGWGDQENSRLSTACYCEQTFSVVLCLAYKYGSTDPKKALLQNVMLGGHSTARGAVLGAILGAAHGADEFPFVHDLAAYHTISKEIESLTGTVL